MAGDPASAAHMARGLGLCHGGLNTGHENEVSFLIAHRVVKTSAYLKFKCGMRSVSEFCTACGQIEDLEHLFISCESAKQVWKEFTPILQKIIPKENLGLNVLLLRDFQTKHPKRAANLATYLMKMILHKLWTTRCAHPFDRRQVSAQDTINQIKTELKQRISITFNSTRTDISKHMSTWRHQEVLCTLDTNNQLVFKFDTKKNQPTKPTNPQRKYTVEIYVIYSEHIF